MLFCHKQIPKQSWILFFQPKKVLKTVTPNIDWWKKSYTSWYGSFSNYLHVRWLSRRISEPSTVRLWSASYHPGLAYLYLTTMGRRQAVQQLLEDVENLRRSQARKNTKMWAKGVFPFQKKSEIKDKQSIFGVFQAVFGSLSCFFLSCFKRFHFQNLLWKTKRLRPTFRSWPMKSLPMRL